MCEQEETDISIEETDILLERERNLVKGEDAMIAARAALKNKNFKGARELVRSHPVFRGESRATCFDFRVWQRQLLSILLARPTCKVVFVARL